MYVCVCSLFRTGMEGWWGFDGGSPIPSDPNPETPAGQLRPIPGKSRRSPDIRIILPLSISVVGASDPSIPQSKPPISTQDHPPPISTLCHLLLRPSREASGRKTKKRKSLPTPPPPRPPPRPPLPLPYPLQRNKSHYHAQPPPPPRRRPRRRRRRR